MNFKKNYKMRSHLSPLAYLVASQCILFSALTSEVKASQDFFDPLLLELGAPDGDKVDLSAFNNDNGQMPGNYRVDIFLNNEKVDTENIDFRLVDNTQGDKVLKPCISITDLERWGVITKNLSPELQTNTNCINLSKIPQVSSDFKFNKQQLILSFPQLLVNNSARGWVDPKLWDYGIPAITLNYGVSGSNSWSKQNEGGGGENQFVSLRPGVNLGKWQFRNYTTWNRSDFKGVNGETESKWNTIYSYAKRSIEPLKGELVVGDSTSPSDIYSSVPFRGIQLASDNEMLPESQRGYAPVVRGIARSNAQVTIRQNGYIIYQTQVSPGSFEITDMYPTGGAGDLNVTIKESDGSEQHLVIPYATLPILQRENHLTYSLTGAVYRSYDNSIEKTPFFQATSIYGLGKGATIFGGLQTAKHYQSMAFGLGQNFGEFGALSADATLSRGTVKGNDLETGSSYRLRYNKNFVGTGTNFAIAGYRYATDGYLELQEVLDTYRGGNTYFLADRRRNRTELTVNQQLWEDAGSIALTAVREDYWNNDNRLESYGSSYNNSFDGISYSLAYSYNKNKRYSSSLDSNREIYNDQIISFNVSIPLSKFSAGQNITVSYSVNSSKNGNTSNNVILNGTTLADNSLSWGVQQGYTSQGIGNSGGVSANWRSPFAYVDGGYSYDKYSERLNYSLQGSIVVHDESITFGQPLGETIAVVSAPEAKYVSIQGNPGVKTDWRGYAIVPYNSPYRKNNITLDPESFNENTEVKVTTQTVIPTRGAVVKASYETNIGYRALMNLSTSSGKTIPFGASAIVNNNKKEHDFIVGNDGQVFLSGLSKAGTIQVKWGSNENESCSVNYLISESDISQGTNGIINMTEQCIQD